MFTISSLEYHRGKVKRINKINSCDQGQNVLIVRNVKEQDQQENSVHFRSVCA